MPVARLQPACTGCESDGERQSRRAGAPSAPQRWRKVTARAYQRRRHSDQPQFSIASPRLAASPTSLPRCALPQLLPLLAAALWRDAQGTQRHCVPRVHDARRRGILQGGWARAGSRAAVEAAAWVPLAAARRIRHRHCQRRSSCGRLGARPARRSRALVTTACYPAAQRDCPGQCHGCHDCVR